MRRVTLLVALFVGCSSSPESAPTPSDAGAEAAVDEPLDVFVPKQLDAARVPGVSAAVVKHGKVVFTGAWGYADIEKKTKVSVDTIFLVASVSKPFCSVTLMQLVEQGKVKLDDDINIHLPFAIRNPKYPDVPITVRMLLAHTSTIRESYIRLFTLIGPGDSPVSLEEFFRDFLLPTGKYWADGTNFALEYAPGAKNSYSQVGAALAGWIAERVGEKSFAEQAKERILVPLGMKDSSFRLADLDATRIAWPYVYRSTGDQRQEHWGAPFYPAATLRSTAPDLAKFMIAMAKKSVFAGGRLISDATYDESMRVPYPQADPDQAHLWQWRAIEGRRVVGHSGGAIGVSTTMYFDPKDGVAVITLSNSDVHIRVAVEREEQIVAFRAIEERLWRDAAHL